MSEEMLKLLVDGGKGLLDLAKNGTTVLVDEVVKMYILIGCIGILKASVVFIILYIVNKLLSSLTTQGEVEKGNIKIAKAIALVISLVYFTMNTVPHLTEIGKAIVAPNLFLIEKGIKLTKDKE